jgi:serine/threonine-protein kinase
LAWVDRDGREEVIPVPSRPYAFPRLSPDGTMVALYSEDQERDLWVWHFTRRTLTRLTANPELDWTPLWRLDGNGLYFSSTPPNGQAPGVATLSPIGSAVATRLTDARLQDVPTGLAPDGIHLVFTRMTAGGGRDLHLMTLGNPNRDESLIATRFEERNGVVSHNGAWLAYASDSSGQLEVYVRPFPDVSNGQWQVSTSGGDQPLWSRDGSELFYRAADGAIMAARVDLADGRWNATAPNVVVPKGYFTGNPFWVSRQYDVTGDGRRFFVIKEPIPEDVSSPALLLIQNWSEELKRLVPTD